ncbi:TetR/AcrR family transcriptional regulator [Paenibacillus sonchi]|uniref:TetR/AcrR family transcriptional regulator n=1 Tax=Paenibacillus sonchi TaxID=373687 RepID=UPI001E6173DA|nr:TetR family transcriptional regulator [Paenibacillus sonchi]MCE3201784.1 TetR/AcrR family transcriptional regulator [Paenibacillus sonchi]
MASVLPPNPKDPRVIRTRQLILDAFIRQLNSKDFNSITISDITSSATINRATFYAHFPDKYALLEAMLSEAFSQLVLDKIGAEAPLTEESLQKLIIALCAYHESSRHCVKKYDSVALMIEENIKLQLESLLLQLLTRAADTADLKEAATAATMISWSVYGLTYRWNMEGRKESPAALAQRIVQLIAGGVRFLHPLGNHAGMER